MPLNREEIIVNAGFNNTALVSGLRSTGQTVTEWSNRIGTYIAGAFAVGKVAQFTKSIFDLTKQISLTAERLNVTTDEVQKLEYAAAETGVQLDTVAAAMDRIAKVKESVLRGDANGGKLSEVFADFGITLKDIETLSPDELFNRIADSVAKTGVNASVTSDAMELLGKSAGQLLPLLKEFRDQAKNAPIISPDEIADIKKAGEALDTLGFKLKAAGARIVDSFIYVGRAIKEGKGIFAGQKPLDSLAPPSATPSSGDADAGAAGSSGGASGGGTSKNVGDLYQRRAELARKIRQIDKYPRSEIYGFGDELRSVQDAIDLKNAPDEEARLKVQRDQAARDLRIEQSKLPIGADASAAQREKVYASADKLSGIDAQMSDYYRAHPDKKPKPAPAQSPTLAQAIGQPMTHDQAATTNYWKNVNSEISAWNAKTGLAMPLWDPKTGHQMANQKSSPAEQHLPAISEKLDKIINQGVLIRVPDQ